ncbi:phage tail sheath protein FI [Campylobacter blaseri]|uniref:Phage tail protein n=1 Tax=Campylobacter blaseri TaxID=2042961 RepID=A0A2P8QYQ0_9BACT|nr:phage tail sheath subtilisin-like domain-containing protein [Campylobacter blaseri]PSM51369.1 phage tail protein [Campylobacter blaseri]PSM52819.1 phage tail protein [Campylobacter blaseri]QKF86120.1 phage tail sheath protein FI [Campylobacter blaseri]
MAVANYGVNVTIAAEAARPIKVESLTPIGIVGDALNLDEGVHFFVNTTEALSKLSEESVDGSVLRAVEAINDQAVETPIILSVFEKASDDNENITKVINATEEFKFAKSKFGYRPNLLIAPEYSGEDAVKSELEKMATKLKATAIVDLDANDVSEAKQKMSEFGTKRVIAAWPHVKIWDKKTKDYVFAPQSARIAGMIAAVDGAWEYGFSDSYSNRVMLGISGTQYPIDFEPGEGACSADLLRSAGISTIINEQGFRTWGGETTDGDTIWQDLARVRTFDRISEAGQKGVFFAIDKRASTLYHAKRSIEEMLRAFVGANVLLGFELSWSARNTLANITAGKFYLDIRMQNDPIVKQLTLDFIYVDSYGSVLMDKLNK